MPILTIVTPTYNRSKELIQCYESLCKQTLLDFQWLIIDDGSTDKTNEVIEKLQLNKNAFTIEYHYKKNGGKHTALNYSHKFIESEITLVLDSDDTLTSNAVEIIYKEWNKYIDIDKIGILSFLRGYNEMDVIGKNYPNDHFQINSIDYTINKGIIGDKCQVVKTKVFKQYPFPVFENERFLGESYFWINSALKNDTVYINEIIYICEYLDGGLTRTGKKLQINNPLGGMELSKLYFISRFPLKYKIKNSWLYICYGFFAKKSIGNIVKESNHLTLMLLNLPFGWFLYLYWKKNYKY